MAENSKDHRLARAAGRAAREFRERQQADDARLRTERERRRSEEAGPGGEPRRPADTPLTRAATRAKEDFTQRQRADEARLRAERARVKSEDEERLAEREAERRRRLEERDAAEAGLVHPLLRLARIWWLAVSVLLAILAGALVWNGRRAAERGGVVTDPLTGIESIGPLGGPTGQYMMAGVAGVLALTALWGWVGLLRRRRGAVSTLTFLALVVAVPAFLRGNGVLVILAITLIVGAVLVWLPPVRSRVRR